MKMQTLGLIGLAVIIAQQFFLIKKTNKVFMKQTELAQELGTVKETLSSVATGVEKIGTETTTLQGNVASLEEKINNGDVSEEIVSAFNAVKEQTAVVASKVAAVDALVPDAAPTPTPEGDGTTTSDEAPIV